MSACRFCAESVPPGAGKCPACGEALPAPAALRWEGDELVVLTPGDMPIGVCFGCAAVAVTRPRRVLGRRDAAIPHVDLPLCAACARRADALPMVGVATLAAAGLSASCLWPLLVQPRIVPLLGWATAAFALMVLVGLALTTYHHARTRVRVQWTEREARVRLTDPRAVRRAVERDGI